MAGIPNPKNTTKRQPYSDALKAFDLKPTPSRKRNRAAKAGAPSYVYLMENRLTGMVKVGHTLHLARRLDDVNKASGTEPGERAYWGWIAVERSIAPKLEAALHREWADARGGGEWFDLRGKQVFADATSLAKELCGDDYKIVGMGENVKHDEAKWTDVGRLAYSPGSIAGPRVA